MLEAMTSATLTKWKAFLLFKAEAAKKATQQA
jgi:hypothetical protein